MADTKYVVTLLCNNEDNYSIKHLDTLFSSKKAAKSALANFFNTEYQKIRKNGFKGNFSDFRIGDDVLYCEDVLLIQGKILEVKEEEAEETLVDVLIRKYGEKHRYIARGFLQNAYNAFCHHFSIDKAETEYACGSLEKLARILGKDFRDSDLLFLIAESFERIFDPEYSLVLKAWQDAIIDVVGEEKYEAAFEEGDITAGELLEIILNYKEKLGFSDEDVDHIFDDKKMIAKIIIAITAECEDNEVLFTDLDMRILDINTEGILKIIKEVYEGNYLISKKGLCKNDIIVIAELNKENLGFSDADIENISNNNEIIKKILVAIDDEVDPSPVNIIKNVYEEFTKENSHEIFADNITAFDLIDLITAFKDELDFSILDIEGIKVDEVLTAKIINAVTSYCEDNEVNYLDLNHLSVTDDIHFKNILIIIKNVYTKY